MNNLARDIEHVMLDGFEGSAVIRGGQDEFFEPGDEIEGELPNQEIGPVGMKTAGGQFLQIEAVLVLFDEVLHVGVLQMPGQ